MGYYGMSDHFKYFNIYAEIFYDIIDFKIFYGILFDFCRISIGIPQDLSDFIDFKGFHQICGLHRILKDLLRFEGICTDFKGFQGIQKN